MRGSRRSPQPIAWIIGLLFMVALIGALREMS